MTLHDVEMGKSAKVTGLLLEGAERRRLLDLGLAIGAIVEAVRKSPLGDPVSYRIRGATIALRREQAEKIEVAPA